MKNRVIVPFLFIFTFLPTISFAAQEPIQASSKILKGKKIQKSETISREDLLRIPIAWYRFLDGKDTDKDGLSDELEVALGTNPIQKDSDNDSYDDKTEVLHEYDPLNGDRIKLPIDGSFAKKKKGLLLIEVSGKDSFIWYVSIDSKAYFLGSAKNIKKNIQQAGLLLQKGLTFSLLEKQVKKMGEGTKVQKQISGIPQQPPQTVQAKNPDSIPKAHTAFGITAFKELFKEEGDKSIFISPASIALALSMVLNGAQGETKEAMQKTLQLKGIDMDILNKESLGLLTILKNPDSKVELSIANSVWSKKGFDFRKDFIDTLKNYFFAQATTLDFSDSQAASTINSWVSANTKNKIQSILTSPIPSDSVMYLINAVYFKGSWSQEFDKKLTEEKDFTNWSKVVKKHPLMKQERKMSYFETPDFQSVRLEYGTNKRLSMVVFLPKKDLKSFIETLDDKKWNEWMNGYKQTWGTVLLPRFKMEYEKGLIPTLKKMGMESAFNDAKADFSGIGKGLKISEVKHKTYIDVNEEGTEAAAVTSIGVGITSVEMPIDKPFVMEVNRPFFYAIQDVQSGEIIFMGTLTDVSK